MRGAGIEVQPDPLRGPDGRFRRATPGEQFARQAQVPGGATGDLVRDALAARHGPPEPAPPAPVPPVPVIPAGPRGGARHGGDLVRQALRGLQRHNPSL
jgi:hypothetical protein